jgi:ribosomal protein L11
LGNLGVNTITFCNAFNNYTKNLPTYFLLKVTIFIYENRTTNFTFTLPPVGFFFNLVKFERTIGIKISNKFQEKIIQCITLSDLLKIAIFKFPYLPLKQSVSMV